MDYTNNAALMFVTVEDATEVPGTAYAVTEVWEEDGETAVTTAIVNGSDMKEYMSAYPDNTDIRVH